MKLGDTKTVEYICKERECATCGQPATHCLTFLLEGGRLNPKSSAYGGDDVSWCADETIYSCDEHEKATRQRPPEGYKWCSDFYRYKDGKETFSAGRYLYWEKIVANNPPINQI